MNESDYKRRLVKAVNALPGGYARRIEDRFAIGVPDMIFKLPGGQWFWAEGKIVEGNKFGPTPRQWEEGLKIQAAETAMLLIGWKLGVMYISPCWLKQVDYRDCHKYVDHVDGLFHFFNMIRNPQ